MITRSYSLLEKEVAMSEGLNSQIQKIKRMACGFRNIEHFKKAISFHWGGLDLYLLLNPGAPEKHQSPFARDNKSAERRKGNDG